MIAISRSSFQPLASGSWTTFTLGVLCRSALGIHANSVLELMKKMGPLPTPVHEQHSNPAVLRYALQNLSRQKAGALVQFLSEGQHQQR